MVTKTVHKALPRGGRGPGGAGYSCAGDGGGRGGREMGDRNV